MKYDKKGNVKRELLDLPPEEAPEEGRESVPTDEDLVRWIRRRAQEAKASQVMLSKKDYRAYRAASKRRSPTESWLNGSGLVMIVVGTGLKKGEACFR